MLPDGEMLVQMAWCGQEQLVVLVEHEEGYALRSLVLTEGEFTVLTVPRSFLNLKPGVDGDSIPEFFLAPGSANLAVLETTARPLDQRELSLYRLDGSTYAAVATRGMPAGFWPAQVGWASSGERLYVSSQQYLFPDQEYSIGAIDMRTGSFSGLALKANIDLIEQLVFIPVRGALAVKCSGYHGEYPDNPMLVLFENSGSSSILHAQAGRLFWYVLDNGLLLAGELPAFGAPSPAQADAGSGEQWVLEPGESELKPVDLAFATGMGTLQSTADGRWYGFLTHPAEVGVAGGSDMNYLGLQRISDGKTLLTSEPCSLFAFSTDAGYVCAASEDRSTVYLYQLPDN